VSLSDQDRLDREYFKNLPFPQQALEIFLKIGISLVSASVIAFVTVLIGSQLGKAIVSINNGPMCKSSSLSSIELPCKDLGIDPH
jgi:hypothetical protein